MSTDHKVEINYIFRNDPMALVIDDTGDDALAQHQAAHRLLEHHRSDLADAAAIPAADAPAEDILRFANDQQITDIRVARIHNQDAGGAPGHHKQP